jgi:hypothetical protein
MPYCTSTSTSTHINTNTTSNSNNIIIRFLLRLLLLVLALILILMLFVALVLQARDILQPAVFDNQLFRAVFEKASELICFCYGEYHFDVIRGHGPSPWPKKLRNVRVWARAAGFELYIYMYIYIYVYIYIYMSICICI